MVWRFDHLVSKHKRHTSRGHQQDYSIFRKSKYAKEIRTGICLTGLIMVKKLM